MYLDRSADINTKGKMKVEEREIIDPIEANERSPLLPRNRRRSEHERTQSSLPHLHKIHDPRTILYTLVGIIFVISLGAGMMTIPNTRIVEDVLCHQYYDAIIGYGHIGMRERIDEDLCKVDVIQKELAFVTGISDGLDAVPSIFCAIPYGILADKVGRRPILFLSIIGMILSNLFGMAVEYWWHIFPLRLIFLGPICLFIGGGYSVTVAMIYAIIADISTEQARAVDFLFAGIGSLLAGLLGPTIGASLMKLSSPWLPMVVGITVFALGSFLTFLLPETLHLRKLSNPPSPISWTKAAQNQSCFSKVGSHIRHMTTQAKETGSVLKSLSTVLLLLTFFTHLFTSAAERFTAVYVSKRFHWHLSDTSYLLSLVAFINILLLTLLLPYLSHLLTSPTSPLPRRYHLPTPQKDLLLARLSILTMTFGALLIAGPSIHFVIFGLVTYTLGNGFTSLCRSVVTTLVDERHVARLYSLVTIFDTLGAVVAGPVLPWLFGVGLSRREAGMGDTWMGAPFLGTAVVCGLGGLAVFCVRLPGKGRVGEEGLDGDGDLGV